MKQGLHITKEGIEEWYLNDQLHRTNGPAVKHTNGNQTWYLNGKLHITDGPAIEWSYHENSYYLMNKKLTYTDWLEKRKEYIIQDNIKSIL